MTHLLLLIPLTLSMAVIGLWAFIWALRNNQYEDLEGDACRVLIPGDPPDVEAPRDASPTVLTKDNDTPTSS